MTIEKISEDTGGLAFTAQFRILIDKVNEIIDVVNSRETFVEKYAEVVAAAAKFNKEHGEELELRGAPVPKNPRDIRAWIEANTFRD